MSFENKQEFKIQILAKSLPSRTPGDARPTYLSDLARGSGESGSGVSEVRELYVKSELKILAQESQRREKKGEDRVAGETEPVAKSSLV